MTMEPSKKTSSSLASHSTGVHTRGDDTNDLSHLNPIVGNSPEMSTEMIPKSAAEGKAKNVLELSPSLSKETYDTGAHTLLHSAAHTLSTDGGDDVIPVAGGSTTSASSLASHSTALTLSGPIPVADASTDIFRELILKRAEVKGKGVAGATSSWSTLEVRSTASLQMSPSATAAEPSNPDLSMDNSRKKARTDGKAKGQIGPSSSSLPLSGLAKLQIRRGSAEFNKYFDYPDNLHVRCGICMRFYSRATDTYNVWLHILKSHPNHEAEIAAKQAGSSTAAGGVTAQKSGLSSTAVRGGSFTTQQVGSSTVADGVTAQQVGFSSIAVHGGNITAQKVGSSTAAGGKDSTILCFKVLPGQDLRNEIREHVLPGFEYRVLSAQGDVGLLTLRGNQVYTGRYNIVFLQGNETTGFDLSFATPATAQMLGGRVTRPVIAAGEVDITLCMFRS